MSTDNTSNNKRIAKNTIVLYFRMLLTMAITLYTSRVILQTLGVEDFGVYNVVGGVIAMFSFINDAMTVSTQRYITFALGKGNESRLKMVFTTAFQIHLAIALFIILIGETVGLWFVMNKLVIPAARMSAALVVYQCTIAASVVTILLVPYNATIVAHERMSAFAYMSIFEVAAKLLIVYMLLWTPWDKLVVYGILLLCVQVILSMIYFIYCKRNFIETGLQRRWDKELLKGMSGFAGWSFFGNLAIVFYSQGLNMMLNMFFGPVVNAARGIALQVQGAIQKLVGSFQMALNPQITKNYASGQLDAMYLLMYRSARFSFFLMYMFGLALILECDYILHLWLGVVPENTVIFCQLMIITSLLYTVVNPCAIGNQATGKVKLYQIVVGCILLLILPISYILLRMGMPAYSVFIVHFCMESVAQVARMFLLRHNLGLSIRGFCKNVYLPIAVVVCVSSVLPIMVHLWLADGMVNLIGTTLASLICVSLFSYLFGLNKREKEVIGNKIIALVRRK